MLPPRGLDRSQDQELGRWGTKLWNGSRSIPLASIPDDAFAIWTCAPLRELRNYFHMLVFDSMEALLRALRGIVRQRPVFEDSS